MNKSCLVVMLGTWLALGCVGRPEGEVVIYASVDRDFAGPLLDAFERKHSEVTVSRQYDVEASKTLGLVNRLIQEAKKPRCDVFWNGEIIQTIRLSKLGLLAPRTWSVPESWQKGYHASDGTWVACAARARVLLINKESISDPSAYPRSVRELSDPRWSKQCGLANPMFGTTSTHFAVIASRDPTADEWFEQVSRNANMFAGNKQVAIAVGTGQIAWGLTDTDDAIVEIENGMPVEMIYPDQDPGREGTLFLPTTIAVLRNSPNPGAAGSLADYLSSEEAERRLTMASRAHLPLWPNNASASSSSAPSSGIAAGDIRWMEVDFEQAAETWESLAPKLMQWFR